MKTIALTTLSLILGASVFAEPLQVEIAARFEGFGSRFSDDVNKYLTKDNKAANLLSAPHVTTKSGQRAVIEIIREVPVPETPHSKITVNSGVSLEVTPVIADGQISLSGRSIARRQLGQGAAQPLGAVSFATLETFFSGAVEDGKELTIAVGDGPRDKARIILTVRLLDPSAAPAR